VLLREKKAADGAKEKSDSDGLNVDAVSCRSSRKAHDDAFFIVLPRLVFFLKLLLPPELPRRRPRPQLFTLPTVPSEAPRVSEREGDGGGGEDFSLTRLPGGDKFEG
jgi:hypothetical protein